MISATQSHNGYLRHSGDYLVANDDIEASTGTSIAELTIDVRPEPVTPLDDEFISTSDLMAIWSDDETDQALLREARQWTANTLYGDECQTLRAHRLRRGFSQSELAERASTSQSHIARVEKGSEDIRLSTARKIAIALGISLDELERCIREQTSAVATNEGEK